MSFDDTVISGISAKPFDADLFLSWASSEPAGTTYQVYLDQRLVWHGTALSCVVPLPTARVQVDIGAVGVGEGTTDFSADLDPPPGTGSRARLTWLGGTYLDDDIKGFNVYGEGTPGGGIDYDEPLAFVAAYPANVILDGFGYGGFGQGGFGQSASSYEWTSDPLTSGTWEFGIKPITYAGNEGTAVEDSVDIEVPPEPPAADANGNRLTASLNTSNSIVTLSWLASPG